MSMLFRSSYVFTELLGQLFVATMCSLCISSSHHHLFFTLSNMNTRMNVRLVADEVSAYEINLTNLGIKGTLLTLNHMFMHGFM